MRSRHQAGSRAKPEALKRSRASSSSGAWHRTSSGISPFGKGSRLNVTPLTPQFDP